MDGIFKRGMVALLAGAMIGLTACGDSAPPTFASPADELDRIESAGDLECERLRPDYWFCQGEAGFAHLYTAKAPGVAEPLVARVMLEGDTGLNADIAGLYGFSADDLEALVAGGSAVTRGGFTLLMDPTWKQPVIRGSTGSKETGQEAGKESGGEAN